MTFKIYFRGLLFMVAGVAAASCEGDRPPIDPPPAASGNGLAFVSRVFAEAQVGENYVEPLTAKGGVEPYTWSLDSETLPGGLQLVGSAIVGVPTEAGRFAAILRVQDSEGAVATGAINVRVLAAEEEPMEMPMPMPVVPTTRCDTPIFLELGDSTRVTAKLPDTAAKVDDAACGLSAQDAATFFVVPVLVESHVTLAIESPDGMVRAGMLANVCPAPSALIGCGASVSLDVEAGNYLVLVAGTPGASFTLDLTRETKVPPPPPGPPTCANPTVVDLSTGNAWLAGTFDEALNEQSGSCTYGYEEVVYALELDEPGDLRISGSTSGSAYYLRSGSCAGGRELGCFSYDALYQPNLAAGTYYLIVEKYWSDQMSYSLLVEKLPATPRPSNDTCTTAQALTFAGDRVTATANLTSAVSSSSFSWCTSGRAVYYTFELAEPSNIRIESTSSNFEVELGQGACFAPQSIACGDTYDDLCNPEVLQPGTYWLAVSERWSQTPPLVNTVTIVRSDPPISPANDLCEDAEVITTPVTINGSFAGAAHEYTAPAACSYSGSFPEVYYALEVTERSDLSVSVTGGSGVQAFIVSGGCAGPDRVECVNTYSGGTTLYGLEPGPYGIIVEQTQSTSYNYCPAIGVDSFTLSVDLQASRPQPANDLCAGSSTITLATIGSVVSIIGTTEGASDDVADLQCPNSYSYNTEGPDVFYKIVLGEAGRIAVSATAAFPVMLSLHGASCDSVGAFACSTSWSGYSFETLAAFPAGEYYVRVDHETGSFGNFTPTDFILTAELLQ